MPVSGRYPEIKGCLECVLHIMRSCWGIISREWRCQSRLWVPCWHGNWAMNSMFSSTAAAKTVFHFRTHVAIMSGFHAAVVGQELPGSMLYFPDMLKKPDVICCIVQGILPHSESIVRRWSLCMTQSPFFSPTSAKFQTVCIIRL